LFITLKCIADAGMRHLWKTIFHHEPPLVPGSFAPGSRRKFHPPRVERLKGLAWVRLSTPVAPVASDRLLEVDEAAARLTLTKSHLYKKTYPFTVRLSPGRVRFSSRGIDEFIRRRAQSGHAGRLTALQTTGTAFVTRAPWVATPKRRPTPPSRGASPTQPRMLSCSCCRRTQTSYR
jgi:predicted DNA-binding transcriptional regulator AlpA